MELDPGTGVVFPAAGASIDPTGIPEVIRSTGFDPGEIRLVAVGKLRQEDDLLLLELKGRLPRLVLAGGELIGELTEKPELLGEELRITGRLHGSHADRPPGLTVESWEATSDTPADDARSCGHAASNGGSTRVAAQDSLHRRIESSMAYNRER